jgi:DNA-entry nuclease
MKKALSAFLLFIVVGLSTLGGGCEAHAADSIPEYSGSPSVEINGNKPEFTRSELTTVSYEIYGNLDQLGRCTPAIACLGKDLMPTQERESIGSVKPTGWNQNKYPGLVDSDPPYLYNRCHMIGFQLTGENANEQNLITGTRYMNIEGMLPYENKVAEYIRTTGNHVMYRVTPVFEGDNLLCSGVKMEAYSVEDSGRGIRFNVYCYNVQPGVDINYSDGSNTLAGVSAEDFIITVTPDVASDTRQAPVPTTSYIANKNSKKFHDPLCDSVNDMKEKNKLYFDGTRDELIGRGYVPCKRCHP